MKLKHIAYQSFIILFQKPLLLQGHERAITQIKYNREGDLLFSASKDNKPNVWYSLNGERLGTFNGHQGAIWCIDVDWTTTKFMSGAGDNTFKIWDCETGKEIGNVLAASSVRSCMFSFSATMAVYTTDKAMRQPCEMFIIDTRTIDSSFGEQDPTLRIPIQGSRISSILWDKLDETIISGHENGEITQWDLRVSNLFLILS